MPSKRKSRKATGGFFYERFFGQNPGAQLKMERPASPLETEMLTEMLKEGYKRCAMKYHPDHEGGDPVKMLELNRIKKELGL